VRQQMCTRTTMACSPPSGSKPAADLLPCQVLGLDQITVVNSEEDLILALKKLSEERQGIGFDTESKPIFVKGQKNPGPHLMQLAVHDHAFLLRPKWFQREEVRRLLSLQHLLAFGPLDDERLLKSNFGIDGLKTVDVGRRVQQAMGVKYRVGPKQAMNLVMGCAFGKPRHITLSNWAAATLNEKQLLYAANDAWIAREVYLALQQKTEVSN